MSETPKLSYAETAIEPELPIIDAHHHLFPPGGAHGHGYMRDEFDQDLNAGHNIVATVFIDCEASYRTSGPEYLAPVGETEWVMTQRSDDGALSGIVPHANLFLGRNVGEVLDAHRDAGGTYFKGIRHNVAWDRNPDTPNARRGAGEHTLLEPNFQEGLAELNKRGLVYETWLYFNQLEELAEVAKTFPGLRLILNHIGGPVVVGAYAGHRDDVLREWRQGVLALAPYDNVFMKIGGIGFRAFVDESLQAGPRTSEFIANYWRPEILFCIETMGAQRCMFESNYPQDRPFFDYVTIWNTFKRVSADLDPSVRRQLFEETARRAYSL